jgi:hypothetical protein
MTELKQLWSGTYANLPFIIIDGVGAAESSYFSMAWFARPSFRHR